MEALTKEQISKSARTFVKLAMSYGAINDDIIVKMGDKLVKSPASIKFGCYEGGLVQFITKFTTMAIKLNEAIDDGHPAKVDKNTLAKVSLIYQISKHMMYEPETQDWLIQKGQLFKYAKSYVSMGMGSKSAKFVIDNGISLTDEEFSTLVSLDDAEKHYDSALTIAIRDAIKRTMFEYEK